MGIEGVLETIGAVIPVISGHEITHSESRVYEPS